MPSATSPHRADVAGEQGVTRGWPAGPGVPALGAGVDVGRAVLRGREEAQAWGHTTKGTKWARGAGGPEAPGLDLLGETHEGGRVRAAQGRQHPAAGAWLGVLVTPRCGGAPAEGGVPGLGSRSRCTGGDRVVRKVRPPMLRLRREPAAGPGRAGRAEPRPPWGCSTSPGSPCRRR